MNRYNALLGLACLLIWLSGGAVCAHEVPDSVVVRAFVKPQDETLRVLVRAPLEAMRDVSFPLRGPGYLELARADAALRDAAELWLADAMTLLEDGQPLNGPDLVAVRASLPSSRTFSDFETALEHLKGPGLPLDTELYWEQGLLDVWFEYRIRSERSEFAIVPGFARLGGRTVTVLHFLPPGGPERVYEFVGDPGRVVLDPGWTDAAGRFVELGFRHVLDGADHLLFLVCLVIPFRRLRDLVLLVTAFTLAHSVTLAAAVFGMAPRAGWFPPLIETLIAASIVFMALENLFGRSLERRWMLTFAFGLVHGFGYAFVLGDALQFAGSHLLWSLGAFNVGIELGQLLVVVLGLAVLGAAVRVGLPERPAVLVVSVLVAHTAWHWLLERGSALRAYPLSWPNASAAGSALVLRWFLLVLVVAALAWLLHRVHRRWAGAGSASPGL